MEQAKGILITLQSVPKDPNQVPHQNPEITVQTLQDSNRHLPDLQVKSTNLSKDLNRQPQLQPQADERSEVNHSTQNLSAIRVAHGIAAQYYIPADAKDEYRQPRACRK